MFSLNLEVICTGCSSQCFDKYHRCTKESLDLCSRCLAEENFPAGIAVSDFEKRIAPQQVTKKSSSFTFQKRVYGNRGDIVTYGKAIQVLLLYAINLKRFQVETCGE
jgi:hypothetical protein